MQISIHIFSERCNQKLKLFCARPKLKDFWKVVRKRLAVCQNKSLGWSFQSSNHSASLFFKELEAKISFALTWKTL